MLRKGRLRSRFAQTPEDLTAVQRLRHRCFVEEAGARPRGDGLDCDSFDDRCDHVMVEDIHTQELLCTFRLLPLPSGSEIGGSYSAQFYELDALHGFKGPMVEMGRFCILSGPLDADILRAAWGAMTAYVDERGVELLFGCSSFKGTHAEGYLEAFDLLAERHLAPKRWLPRVKAPNVVRFADRLRPRGDRRRALLRMPPLLKSYLAMGGWVSDHAVIDPEMNTLHVFTGLEIASIPPARARALRAVAG